MSEPRPHRDPLSAHEIEMTVALLDSVRRALETLPAGRRTTGSDAVLVREACHRLGGVLAAVGRRAES